VRPRLSNTRPNGGRDKLAQKLRRAVCPEYRVSVGKLGAGA